MYILSAEQLGSVIVQKGFTLDDTMSFYIDYSRVPWGCQSTKTQIQTNQVKDDKDPKKGRGLGSQSVRRIYQICIHHLV